MKFHVKVITRNGRRSLFEFDSKDTAFEFGAALFNEMNPTLDDPVASVVIGPAP